MARSAVLQLRRPVQVVGPDREQAGESAAVTARVTDAAGNAVEAPLELSVEGGELFRLEEIRAHFHHVYHFLEPVEELDVLGERRPVEHEAEPAAWFFGHERISVG